MCLHHCGKHRLLFFSLRLSAWARWRSGDVRGGACTRLCSWRRERGGRSGQGLGRARGRAFRSFSRHSPTCFAAGLRRTTPCKLATEEAFPVSFHQAADPAPGPGSATRVLADVCVSLLEQVASPGDGPAGALPGGPRRRFRWRQSSGVT